MAAQWWELLGGASSTFPGKKITYFDIETAGLRESSQIANVHFRHSAAKTTFHAIPKLGSQWSRFSIENILPQARGRNLLPEKDVLLSIAREISQAQVLAGWNIGIDASKTTGFDIPHILNRAELHGQAVSEPVRKAFQRKKFWDVSFSYRQMTASAFKPLTVQGIATLGLSTEQARFYGQWSGFAQQPFLQQAKGRVAGWQLGFMHKFWGEQLFGQEGYAKRLGGLSGAAHQSSFDVLMTKELGEWFLSPEQGKKMKAFVEEDPRKFRQSFWEAFSSWQKAQPAKTKEYLTLTEDILRSAGVAQARFNAPVEEGILAKAEQFLGKGGKLKPSRIGLGVLAGAGLMAGGLWLSNRFSGKDDAYNTIEGLPHNRFKDRRTFGSGWRGQEQDQQTNFRMLWEKITRDSKVTPQELAALNEHIQVAVSQGTPLQLATQEQLQKLVDKRLNLRAPIQIITGTRGELGLSGMASLGGSEGKTWVGTEIDPSSMALNLSTIKRPDVTAQKALNYFENVFQPEATAIHESIHTYWERQATPQEREPVNRYVQSFLQGQTSSEPLKNLAMKSPIYADWIQRGFVHGIGHELVAHRGTEQLYPGGWYRFDQRLPQDVEQTISNIVRKGGRLPGRIKTLTYTGTEAEAEDIVASPSLFQSLKEAVRLHRWDQPVSHLMGLHSDLPRTIMDQPIDPRILEFREKVWDVRAERAALERELRAKEKEQVSSLGSFEQSDFIERNIRAIKGLNYKNSQMMAVNLQNFNINVEDADTILLKRKGFWNRLLGDEIQVRLAGLDAPEVAGHGSDPLESVRIWQEQPGGTKATAFLENLIREKGDSLGLVVSTGRKTYGRYLGALHAGRENVNLELLEAGMTTALPFGPQEWDVLNRNVAEQVEKEAFQSRRGIWHMKRYQAMREANEAIGRELTHNLLTRVDKMARNLSLGAYGSWLAGMGETTGELTPQEVAQARRMGRVLRKTHGEPQSWGKSNTAVNAFSGADDNYNTITGLSEQGFASQLRKVTTDFGSGWDPVKKVAEKLGVDFFDLLKSKGFQKSVLEAWEGGRGATQLGKGIAGEAWKVTASYQGFEIPLVAKVAHKAKIADAAAFGHAEDPAVALFNEANILSDLTMASSQYTPSLYRLHTQGAGKASVLFEEFIPGKTLDKRFYEAFQSLAQPATKEQILATRKTAGAFTPRELANMYETIGAEARLGWIGPDIHGQNVVLNEYGAFRIDYGSAKRISKQSPEIEKAVGESAIEAHSLYARGISFQGEPSYLPLEHDVFAKFVGQMRNTKFEQATSEERFTAAVKELVYPSTGAAIKKLQMAEKQKATSAQMFGRKLGRGHTQEACQPVLKR